jgi:transposase-like protein
VLDGRNRLAALKLLGIDDPEDAPRGKGTIDRVRTLDAVHRSGVFTGSGLGTAWVTKVDPATFVMSMNVHRRHLTAEQKRQAVADHIKLDPTASDRKIAKKVGVSDKTATKVRDDLQRRGEIPHVSERTDSVGRKQPARKPRPKPQEPTVGPRRVARSEIPNVSTRTDSAARRKQVDEFLAAVQEVNRCARASSG